VPYKIPIFSKRIAQKCGCPHFQKQHPTDSQLRFPNAWLRPSSCRHRNQMLQHAADCLIRMFGTQNRRRWSLETDDIPQVLRNSKSMNLVETCQTRAFGLSAGHAVEHWSALTAWCYNAVGHDVTWISQNRCRRIRVDVAMSSKNLYQLGTNRKAIWDVKSFGIDLAQDLLFLQFSSFLHLSSCSPIQISFMISAGNPASGWPYRAYTLMFKNMLSTLFKLFEIGWWSPMIYNEL